MKQVLFASLCVLVFASCKPEYKKTATGLKYRVTSSGSGPKLAAGNFIKFNIEFSIPEKDTVFPGGTFGKIPAYGTVDTTQGKGHNFMEVLPLCKVGDKVEVSMSVDTLVKMGQLQYQKPFAKGGRILCKFEVVRIFPDNPSMVADYQLEITKEKDKEIAALEKNLAAKKIKTVKTKGGVLVEIINEGDAVKGDSGKAVTAFYTGKLMSNGKKFDSNQDTAFHHTEPYTFVVKQDPVIQGWTEAVGLLGKGAKARIYIPAMLGYGVQGSPPTIPAYADLMFDLEIINVGEPAVRKPAPMQAAPNQERK